MTAVNTSKPPALEKARRVSVVLGEAVRLSRLSSRRRRMFDVGALSRRRGARTIAILPLLALFGLVVGPNIVSVTYFGFLASPQYVAETKFIVQGGSNLRADGIEVVTGLPATNVIQDTQLLMSYIESPAIVERLQAELNLRQLFGSSDIDWIARFAPKEPFEELVDYWKSRVAVSVQLPGGLVSVSVRAFSAKDAYEISKSVLQFSEELVNNLNQRMLADNITSSRHELERATRRLGEITIALEKARNTEGILDAGQASRSVMELITGLKSEQLKLQHDYDGLTRAVRPDAPQMRALRAKVAAIEEQIKTLQAQLTTSAPYGSSAGVLSQAMTKFSELDLEKKIAERQYATAAATFQLAHVSAERRLLYLQTFVYPSLPEEARYPRRILSIVVVFVGSLTAFGVVTAMLVLARNHMA